MIGFGCFAGCCVVVFFLVFMGDVVNRDEAMRKDGIVVAKYYYPQSSSERFFISLEVEMLRPPYFNKQRGIVKMDRAVLFEEWKQIEIGKKLREQKFK
jgi:hypothetical protein